MKKLIPAAALAIGAATALVPGVAQASPADHEGCNQMTCIQVKGNAGNYQVFGFLVDTGSGFGHYHIWGPNLEYNGPDQRWSGGRGAGSPIQYGYGAGQVCSEFWINDNGTYRPTGRACGDVS
ncbi:hypothetical protein [Amycolatopsis minnesotensis]|uniref:Peptidase inhibitor family I36 n=1 Tax=Amycolatopsis minnesotensis TaxID=337894 RepID=A0ABN2SSQ2_9PSEU